MTMAATSRAPKGGAFGANGEWYEGGKFINTVAKNQKKNGSRQKVARKMEIAPFQWELAPEGMVSLYRQFAGAWGRVENGVAILTDGGNGDRLDAILAYDRKTREQANAMLAAWNAGERWIPAWKPTPAE